MGTPVLVMSQSKQERINLISSANKQGGIRFMVYLETMRFMCWYFSICDCVGRWNEGVLDTRQPQGSPPQSRSVLGQGSQRQHRGPLSLELLTGTKSC